MKKNFLALAGLSLIALQASCATDNPAPRPQISGHPAWVTDQMIATVKYIGVNPDKDTIEQNNTHWRFRARRKITPGAYSCPAGSTVDISQAVILVMAPKDAVCRGPDNDRTDFITLSMDGAVVTLVQ